MCRHRCLNKNECPHDCCKREVMPQYLLSAFAGTEYEPEAKIDGWFDCGTQMLPKRHKHVLLNDCELCAEVSEENIRESIRESAILLLALKRAGFSKDTARLIARKHTNDIVPEQCDDCYEIDSNIAIRGFEETFADVIEWMDMEMDITINPENGHLEFEL